MSKPKGKMKEWRRNSPGNHLGRKLKIAKMSNHFDVAVGAPDLLAGLFERAGIEMPAAEYLRSVINAAAADPTNGADTSEGVDGNQ